VFTQSGRESAARRIIVADDVAAVAARFLVIDISKGALLSPQQRRGHVVL
jgi:hypothetical protein